MKLSVRATQLILVSGAVILIVGLVLAPRLPSDKRGMAEANPADLQLQRAVSLVQNGQNPMEGIRIMRELLEKDSTNVDVHWQLAQFSLTSRQIDNAAFRFRKVLEYDKDHKYPQAYFWLAQTDIALDKKEDAIPLLKKYLTLEKDTAITHRVRQMLYKLEQDSL